MAFSLKHLLFVMLVIAVGLSAIALADSRIIPPLFEGFAMITIVIISYSISVSNWVSGGDGRIFHIGFVCWSGTYFTLSKFHLVSNLFTTKLLSMVYPT